MLQMLLCIRSLAVSTPRDLCKRSGIYVYIAYFAIYDNLLKWTYSRYFQLSPNSYYQERTMNNSNVGSILLARLYVTYLIKLEEF